MASGYDGPSAPTFDFGPAPDFNFTFDAFKAPTLDDAKAEPGYEFARGEGLRAMQQSAAGRGVLRTSGTLKDLAAWGNRFAEQNYGNVFNRAASTHDRNFGNAFDVAKTRYMGDLDEWSTNAAAKQRAGELAFQRAWEEYVYSQDDAYRRWRDIYTSGAN